MLFLCLMCCMAKAQVFTPSNPPLIYLNSDTTKFINVEPADGLSATKLYDNAILWVNGFFKSPKSVITVADREAGLLVLKCINSDEKETVVDRFTLIFQFKENKYRWEISSFTTTFNMPDLGIRNDVIPLHRQQLCINYQSEGAQKKLNFLMWYISSFREGIATKENDW